MPAPAVAHGVAGAVIRVRVSVLTTVIGGAAREPGDCGDETEALEIVVEVCGILIHLTTPPGRDSQRMAR